MPFYRSASVPKCVAHRRNPGVGSPWCCVGIGPARPDADAVGAGWFSRKDGPEENTAGRMPLAIRAAGQAGRSYRGDATVRR